MLERTHPLLDDLGRLGQDLLRDGQPKPLCGLEVDHEVERRGLFDGEIGRLGPLEDPVHVGGGAPVDLGVVGPVGREPARIGELAMFVERRQPMLRRQLDDPSGVTVARPFDGTSSASAPQSAAAVKAPAKSSAVRAGTTAPAAPGSGPPPRSSPAAVLSL